MTSKCVAGQGNLGTTCPRAGPLSRLIVENESAPTTSLASSETRRDDEPAVRPRLIVHDADGNGATRYRRGECTHRASRRVGGSSREGHHGCPSTVGFGLGAASDQRAQDGRRHCPVGGGGDGGPRNVRPGTRDPAWSRPGA